jgi:hypothetical protein
MLIYIAEAFDDAKSAVRLIFSIYTNAQEPTYI